MTTRICISSLVVGLLAASSSAAIAQQPYPDLKGSWIGPGQSVTQGKTDHWPDTSETRTGLPRGLLDPRRQPAGGKPAHGLPWADGGHRHDLGPRRDPGRSDDHPHGRRRRHLPHDPDRAGHDGNVPHRGHRCLASRGLPAAHSPQVSLVGLWPSGCRLADRKFLVGSNQKGFVDPGDRPRSWHDAAHGEPLAHLLRRRGAVGSR